MCNAACLPHWHRLITGWKLTFIYKTLTSCLSSEVTLDSFTALLCITRRWRVWKSCMWSCEAMPSFFFSVWLFSINWADCTLVKTLYKAYPSFHNTAKSKKGDRHCVLQGGLNSFTSDLFFSKWSTFRLTLSPCVENANSIQSNIRVW